MPQEMIALLMFSTMLVLMITGQRVFGVIGVVAVLSAREAADDGRRKIGQAVRRRLRATGALVSLLEDARVERLAIQRFPGLERLWRPLHTAMPMHDCKEHI